MPSPGVPQTLSSTLLLAVLTAAFLLPAALPLDNEAEIVLGEDQALTDDLIISKRSAECPEDDEDDCVYDLEPNQLIYPVTVITTRKPRHRRQTTPATTQHPLDGGTRQSVVDHLCADDDEDCSASSGVEEPATAVMTDPTTSSTPASTSTAVIPTRLDVTSTRQHVGHGPPPSPTRPPPPTRRSDGADRPAAGPLSAAPPPFPDQATPGQRYSSLDGQQHHQQRGSSSDSMAAISMNIILIVGIAAAFVVLLLILIFAFCAYSRQRPVGARARGKASPAGKLDNKGYTYEACNTSPPPTMPVVLNACNYQPLPAAAAPGHPPYSAMSMTFQPMSPDPVDVKPPAKKDVKEWYV